MANKRCIATSSDAKYFPALMAFLRSARRVEPTIPIIVFDGGLTSRQKIKASRLCSKIIQKKPFLDIKGKGKFRYIGQTTLLKFEVSELDFEKVLYLDVDMVIVDKVEPLFSFPEGTVGVVKEVNAIKNMFRPRDRGLLAGSVDIDWESPGFNAGLVAMRPGEWRDLKEKALGLVKKFGPEVFSKTKDQQLLNMIFIGKTHAFPGKYNFAPFYDDKEKQPPAIIHYLTECKPWHFGYPPGFFYREFREFISLVDFPEIVLVDIYRSFRRLFAPSGEKKTGVT